MNRHLLILIFITLFSPSFVAASSETDDLIIWADDVRLIQQVDLFQGQASLEPLNETTARIVWASREAKHSQRDQLRRSPFILAIEPDVERSIDTLNDTYYDKQWAIQEMNFESVWSMPYDQRPTTIAVIDSGADLAHEDLQRTFVNDGQNIVEPDQPVYDANGHGTNIAGLIAAEANNARGIAGVAHSYPVRVLPLQIMNRFPTTKVSSIVQAIDVAIAERVDVINLSLGGTKPSIAEEKAIMKAREAGIIVVASAGNDALKGNPLNYPAAYEGVIAVGATTPERERAPFSNYHPYVTVSAPGTGLWTTHPNDTYRIVQGTSFSTPLVSATIAMMKSVRPSLTEHEIVQLLERSSIDLGSPGRDDSFGYGLLDARLAVHHAANDSFDRRLFIASPTLDLQRPHETNDQWTDETGATHFFMRSGQSKRIATRPGTTWFASSSSVVTVPMINETLLIAKTASKTVLTAQTASTKKRYVVHVTNSPSDATTFAHTSLEGPVRWTSSSPDVASIDANGLITAYRPGTTTIAVSNGVERVEQRLTVHGETDESLAAIEWTMLQPKRPDEPVTITWNEPIPDEHQVAPFLHVASDETLWNEVDVSIRKISPYRLEIHPATTWNDQRLYARIQPFHSTNDQLLEREESFQFSIME